MTNAIYKVIATGTVKNLYTLTQLFNSPLSHEDGDYNYILLKLEKIEDNANKVKISNYLHYCYCIAVSLEFNY